MSSNISMLDPRAYHILSYGTFLGLTFFQSFIAGPVAYKTLPRPLFARLQQVTFPIFFALQTGLSAIIAMTFPGDKLMNTSARINTGITGLWSTGDNIWTSGTPIAVMLLSSAANLLVFGPQTTKVMKERHHQETRDGKKSYEDGPHSVDMQKLNKKFGILHGVSTVSNLIGYGAAIYYGFVIASQL